VHTTKCQPFAVETDWLRGAASIVSSIMARTRQHAKRAHESGQSDETPAPRKRRQGNEVEEEAGSPSVLQQILETLKRIDAKLQNFRASMQDLEELNDRIRVTAFYLDVEHR
jgi:hypothetical protein